MSIDIEGEIKARAADLAREIREAAASSHDEAEFRTKVTRFIEEFADKVRLPGPFLAFLQKGHTLNKGQLWHKLEMEAIQRKG